jgi:riboflavin synthase
LKKSSINWHKTKEKPDVFTGIVTSIGNVTKIEKRGDTRFTIETPEAVDTVAIGASICCSGCCLTVVEKGANWFLIEASAETLNLTTLGAWKTSTRINLERSLKVGDELGGHIVAGHVDGIATIVSIRPEGDSRRFTFEAPSQLARFIARKGSVALDGTSLTVNEVDGTRFGVNMIPHTLAVTTWGNAREGDRINLEIDMLARYVARLTEFNK